MPLFEISHSSLIYCSQTSVSNHHQEIYAVLSHQMMTNVSPVLLSLKIWKLLMMTLIGMVSNLLKPKIQNWHQRLESLAFQL